MSTVDLSAQAKRVEALVQNPCVVRWLRSAYTLPRARSARLWIDSSTREARTASEIGALSPKERARFQEHTYPPSFFHSTFGGTPIALARPLDLLASAGASLTLGQRILEFGYGTRAALHMHASLGMHVVGVDSSEILRALYSAPEDQGDVAVWDDPKQAYGSVRLVCDTLPPRDARNTAEISADFSVLLCKNILKRGYISPPNLNPTVTLGAEPSTFPSYAARLLRPGGLWMIYNISPPFSPEQPWSDGRCPFARDVCEAAGFHIQAFDKDDTPAVQEFARLLSWPDPSSFCASYTLLLRSPS